MKSNGMLRQKETRRKRKFRKRALLFLPVLVIIIFFLLCNSLVDVALVPAVMERTQAFSDITEESVAAQVHTSDIEQNHIKSIQNTNDWLSNVKWEDLSLQTKDGYRLLGTMIFTEKPSHKWVMLLHGYTGWKEEMYPIAYEYAKRGYQVLCPDMRCNGQSEGDFIGMGWTDRLDNQLWLEEILKRDSQAEIVIHGQSMGAAGALMMTGEVLPLQVKAVVSDCGYTNVYEMFQKQLKEWFHLPGFPILDGANLVLQLRGGYNIRKASALEAVKKSKIPILFIHGDQDQFVPVEMAKELYEAANCEKELLIIKGAGHAQSQDKDPDLYYDTIFDFLPL
ncbi:MAG: alpha/beta hydrolase [Lachnospiraceae bacterium]